MTNNYIRLIWKHDSHVVFFDDRDPNSMKEAVREAQGLDSKRGRSIRTICYPVTVGATALTEGAVAICPSGRLKRSLAAAD